MKISAVILTGGQSKRMGRDKSGLELGGKTFLQRLVERYRPWFDRVYLSVDRPGRFRMEGAEEVCDVRGDHPGPLAGVEAAFLAAQAEQIFLTAVDLPFGEPALAKRLLAELGEADACCIRRNGGGLEPLFAVYCRSCLPIVSECLDEGRRSMRSVLERVNTHWVEEADLPEFDLDHILMNVNRPEDFQRAKMAEKMGK